MKIKVLIHLSLLIGISASAWGPTGHRVVGEVAERHLTLAAKAGVAKILGGYSLAEVSTWADEIRSIPEFKAFAELHFADVSLPFKTYEEQEAAHQGKTNTGDAVKATLALENFLRSGDAKTLAGIPALSQVDKIVALKLLVHFVGDLHQPLHLIDELDKNGKSTRGGNFIDVNWMQKTTTNLHSIWDDEMIDQEKLSYEELATFVDHPTEEQTKSWVNSTVLQWADESLSYHDQVFTFTDKLKLPEGVVPLPGIYVSYNYISLNRPVIRQRLDQAGLRLATFLNSLF